MDRTFSAADLVHLALALRRANASGIPNWTYPTVNSAVVPGALDPQPSLDQAVVQEFLGYGTPKQTTAQAAQAGASVSPSTFSRIMSAAPGRSRAELTFAVPPADEATGPVEPDSSSYYHGLYVPPGLQPGQVPKTCPE